MNARAASRVVIALLTVTGCAMHRPTGPTPGEAKGKREAPSTWLSVQRNALDPLAARFRSRALEAAQAAGSLGRTAGTWVSQGPFNLGGRASAPARDPNDGSVLWLGAADGGVFKSVDGGVNWSPRCPWTM